MSEPTQGQRRPFPAIGEVFELTASSEVTGLGLVEAFGYEPKGFWRTSAASIPLGTTRRFNLLAVGYQPDLDAVVRACKTQGGKYTNGCWMKVFNDTFGSNRRNPVGVPDASWGDPRGRACFPVVLESRYRCFDWARSHQDPYRLWLVEVE